MTVTFRFNRVKSEETAEVVRAVSALPRKGDYVKFNATSWNIGRVVFGLHEHDDDAQVICELYEER
jgi:hypothetical protein